VRDHILDLSACAAPAIGAWVVRDGKAEWQPAFDLATVIVTSNAVALVLRRQFARRAAGQLTAGSAVLRLMLARRPSAEKRRSSVSASRPTPR
jgi:hypothetical protein